MMTSRTPNARNAGKRDLQQRAAGDLHQRLGAVIGKRAQSRAEAGRQNHRFHLPCFSISRWRTTTFHACPAAQWFANCSAR